MEYQFTGKYNSGTLDKVATNVTILQHPSPLAMLESWGQWGGGEEEEK